MANPERTEVDMHTVATPDTHDTIPEMPAASVPDERDRVPGPIPAGQARRAMLAALAHLACAVAEVEATSLALARALDGEEPPTRVDGKRRTLSGEMAAVRASVDAILTGGRS